MSQNSPFKQVDPGVAGFGAAAGPWGLALGGIASIGMGIWGARQANKSKEKAREREQKSR